MYSHSDFAQEGSLKLPVKSCLVAIEFTFRAYPLKAQNSLHTPLILIIKFFSLSAYKAEFLDLPP
jgi:hypothetical protein